MTDPQPGISAPPHLVSIDEIVDIKARRPVATTRQRGWGGVTLDLYPPLKDCGGSYPPLDHHLISFCPSGRARLIQRRDGAVHDGVLSAGMSLVMPAGCDSAWEGDAPASVRLRVPVGLVAAAAAEIGRRCLADVAIRTVFSTRDALIERVAMILLGELERPQHPAQALIADHLSGVLAAHLLRGYDLAAAADPPKLSRFELARLTEFVEDNLDRPIGLDELAALVNVSRFHFARLFKCSTGETPLTFVERSRVRRAEALIRETDAPLAEIALTVGFADQSHFTRRFHRHTGRTPGAFAREHRRRQSPRRSG